ncbi:ribosomal protein L6 [Nadsonia fulvescens var. elongata DSM 6958]|uniref:Ribosomal protein L6 n=1 Tax=Nadsonia fulvescens var. elongata DSM 6958 TaxID=857566 RepID=A0A1E3PRG0_9ASCO|nr:ribosomal protein L6 [Nadsonia fulvescens var. elongata DSM 6958]
MKFIQTDQILEIPEGVHVEIKARIVAVTGPRGSLSKNLRHVDVTFQKLSNTQVKLSVIHADRKHIATLRTVKSLINNLIIGVTRGFKYKMRFVYAHFPINVNIIDGSVVEIRNFLGERRVRSVKIAEGVAADLTSATKDEIIFTGNSLEAVSQTAADVQQICRVRNKDIRKFLDGIYVSEKGNIIDEE